MAQAARPQKKESILTGIRDLARHLDISIGTVSRALNDRADVNPQTRDRVREAAARLGYSPNQSGRSLRRGRTDLVGVIIPTGGDQTLITPVFLSVLDGLRRRLSEQRLDLAIFLHGPDDPLFGALRRLTERGLVDGLIIANTQRVDPRIDYLIERRRPFVAFGRSLSGGDHPWVDPDFTAAAESAVEMLCKSGHSRIALMLPTGEKNYFHLILEAYQRAMRRRGLPVERAFIQRRAAGEDGGYLAGAALLATPQPPTAILVSEAIQSLGLYRKLNEAGLRPGRDISLIGILPEERAKILSPALTTFQTDWTAIGVRLGEALIAAMTRPPAARSERQTRTGVAQRPIGAVQSIMPVAFRAGESVHSLRDS
ncbi:MAG: LacI family DNA-binding transcriptional regulator [Roseiarcus sp.]